MDKNKKLYKPHEFAKIIGTTKRALRYYNDKEILMPAYINEEGHKFYSEDSFFEAQRVLSLRFLQFSIEEIKDIQKRQCSIRESLKAQKKMMKEKADTILSLISAIEDIENTMDKSEDVNWEAMFNGVKFAKYNMVYEDMMEYYNERAGEYDEIYEGKGPASFTTEKYIEDVKNLAKFTEKFGYGHIIDIGCGSGYWMQNYYKKCSSFTFLDQSKNMLQLCKMRTEQYKIDDKCKFINDDIFKHKFLEDEKFDCAAAGFLVGHFPKVYEEYFFNVLKKILNKGSKILIIENTWNDKRAKKQNKEDIAVRNLDDGREFKIYKKYYNQYELDDTVKKYGFKIIDSFFGNTFTAVIGEL